jgi:hypothetical protein
MATAKPKAEPEVEANSESLTRLERYGRGEHEIEFPLCETLGWLLAKST